MIQDLADFRERLSLTRKPRSDGSTDVMNPKVIEFSAFKNQVPSFVDVNEGPIGSIACEYPVSLLRALIKQSLESRGDRDDVR